MSGTIPEQQRRDLEALYAAFNRRAIEAVLERLAPDVCWANGMEGGHLEGRAAVREYWTRQFQVIHATVEPTKITVDAQERAVVDVHQRVRSVSGELIADQQVVHVYTFRDGQIVRFDIGGP